MVLILLEILNNMLETTRNKKIVELYKTGDYTMTAIGKRYNISRERVRQLIERQTGIEFIKDIKRMRKERAAERVKENYLKGI